MLRDEIAPGDLVSFDGKVWLVMDVGAAQFGWDYHDNATLSLLPPGTFDRGSLIQRAVGWDGDGNLWVKGQESCRLLVVSRLAEAKG